jgi:hypothetical protein
VSWRNVGFWFCIVGAWFDAVCLFVLPAQGLLFIMAAICFLVGALSYYFEHKR